MIRPTIAIAAAAAALTVGTVPAAAAAPVRTTAVLGVTPGSYVYGNAVPAGARAMVHAIATGSGKTIVTLHVFGLEPNREYGAHAHRNACGASPLDAGGHFQHEMGGATDPAYANPRNEIWLDVTTDVDGNGASQATVDWTFAPANSAHSVVLHDHHTATDPGVAGTAGPRLACLTVEF
ncbi:MAG TPA: superoxide dismutase [Mycobacterium sp.]|jgi:superoxide dismutase, Cu-Zn family|nr:superoxide dismutase [Mycobacterium sp.]